MATTEMINDFLRVAAPLAAEEQARTGIKQIITLTQSAHESNWGQSGPTKKANNLFGVMVGNKYIEAVVNKTPLSAIPNWSANGKPVVEMQTREWSKFSPEKIRYFERPGDIISKKPDGKGGTWLMVNRLFRSYETWKESIVNWADEKVLPHAAEPALAGDLAAYATTMKTFGYATDPNYPILLVGVSKTIDTALKAQA